MKILLLGKTGQVGFELHRMLSLLGTIDAPSRLTLDLMNEEAVNDYLIDSNPDLIVNAAAWTDVDGAEEHQAEAYRLNAVLPAQLATYASERGIRFLHYSSDYVYPGTGTLPWSETSPVGPLNHYGKTKLVGDQAIEHSGADFLIFRISWVYSARGKNFMKTMLRLAQSHTQLEIVSDQVGAPTPACLIATISLLAIRDELKCGIYQLASKGETSWHGFATEIFNGVRQASEPLPLSLEHAEPISTLDYPTPAKRPVNSRMNLSKLENALNLKLPNWKSQLAITLTEFLEKK
ncbi:dTDP-4-dehydrorhamnose reductase [uncultured Amphritea sp.]|uniref:dTDP-4-dehydrorhamnose reductase n=1 Tax=uncultured Amphritea sp. TaxID=981605 RepID=UPI0026332EF1|nr:dTDP-4-dehydrorhamnose reductase [uncultured Amphritea sp.]